MTTLPEQCCILPPFQSDYNPIGRRFKINVGGQDDLEVYSTGQLDSSKVLIAIFDIFGMHSNTLQGADHLAKVTGYRIVVPDFFRGQSWPVDNIPPKEGRPFLNAWIQNIGSWEKVRPGLLATLSLVQKDGAQSVGAYGFCFGAKKLVQGANEKLFKSMALVHPSFFQPEDADNVAVPVALLPSQGEDKDIMNAFWDKIQTKDMAKLSVRQDFLDVHHGFASARSNWDDPHLASKAREAYAVMKKFFENTL